MVKGSPKKVIVGLSGGVDSAVTAAILKNNGHEVVAVHFRLIDKDNKKNLDDVKKICRKLDMPLKIIDVRKKFKSEVIDYFVGEYGKGRTPNPCVMCNPGIKFKLLLGEMARMRADYVATGHYARVKILEDRQVRVCNSNRIVNSRYKTSKLCEAGCKPAPATNKNSTPFFQLLESKDKTKDQSYFLYRLTQKELSRAIFPLGEYSKAEVRKLAKKFNLPVAEKEESQDVCFIPSEGVEKYLQKNIKMKSGMIVDKNGKTIGRHKGLPLYTFGQRKGLEIGGTGPYYVIDKDKKKNIIKVTGCANDPGFSTPKMTLEKVSWIVAEPKLPLRALIATRYRKKPGYGIIRKVKSQKSNVKSLGGGAFAYEVNFEKPERMVTSGQSAVFYSDKGEVLGGGIIA